MMEGLIAALFATATGFVAAGICNSSYSLMTNARLGFGRPGGRPGAARVGLLVVAGPLIILRNSWRAAERGRPTRWLFASALLAAGWSFCLGAALLNLVVMAGA